MEMIIPWDSETYGGYGTCRYGTFCGYTMDFQLKGHVWEPSLYLSLYDGESGRYEERGFLLDRDMGPEEIAVLASETLHKIEKAMRIP